MSADASVTLEWADGEHTFRLAFGQIRELQEKTGVGPARLLARLMDETWLLDDVVETLRLGLIGGGMRPPEARRLVDRYVAARPLVESVWPAVRIVFELLHFPNDDPLPKPQAAKTTTETTTAPAASASAASTEPVPPSA